MIYNIPARLISRRASRDGYILTFEVDKELDLKAGQFLHLRIDSGSFRPYLRRPFSIWDYEIQKGRTLIDVLFNVVGDGTKILATGELSASKLMLPLGNELLIDSAKKHHVMIAGGAGIVPFKLLARKLKEAGASSVTLLFGARKTRQLYGLDELKLMDFQIEVCTDDGSEGRRGLVTGLLEDYLKKVNVKEVGSYACGPAPMLKAVAGVADKWSLDLQVALENRMGCALGACRVCVVKMKDGGGWRYSRICCEGPNYDSSKLLWD